MSPIVPRRPGAATVFSPGAIALAAVVSTVIIVAGLMAVGVIDVSRFRSSERSTVGLVAVPTPAKPIPAYTRIRRDHLWDARHGTMALIYLPPRAVTKEMLVNLSDVIGRVLEHEKAPGYVFTESDFLPKGTREGIVAGIPAGKRAIRLAADRVEGLYGLHSGDRFDLMATMPIDASRGSQSFNLAGVYSQQMALQAQLSNWQKQATVRVIVQNGLIIEPMTTRGVPIMQSSLTEGSSSRVRPVQEVVLAINPEDVALLTEAMAVDAKLTMVPRSGRPDDPVNSLTPDLRPVSPFTDSGAARGRAVDADAADLDAQSFTVVETIMGKKRTLTAVPRP